MLPPEVAPAADPAEPLLPAADLPWLEPFPDRLLDEAAANADQPEARLLARETTELAFLAAIQHLPPRQRAVLILRDVLDWSAKETAASLGTTTASVNSALQRAHATLAGYLPAEARPAAGPGERSLLAGMIDAWERGDASALAALLREDARLVMPPTPSWFDGRRAIGLFFEEHFGPDFPERVRAIAIRANRQPALAVYLRGVRETERNAFALIVLRTDAGAIAELTLFRLPGLFDRFGLPATM